MTNSAAKGNLRLWIVIAVVIAGLTALDIALENAEQTETHYAAELAYRNGLAFLKAGKTNQAVEALRKARALERENQDYELGLIDGLMGAGKVDEAQPLMDELLQAEPNSSLANLVAARLMVSRGKPVQAASYYHRAIYGEWPNDAKNQQIAGRFELIDFYRARGRRQAMLSELIPLQERIEGDRALELKAARLFLDAGAASHAETVYHDLIRQDHKDAQAYLGLGNVELEQGQYRPALSAFRDAARLDESDKETQARLDLTRTLTELDPTIRQLSSMEKYLRSRRVLNLARDDFEKCMEKNAAAANSSAIDVLRQRADSVPDAIPEHVTNELAEPVLNLAEELWQTRTQFCGSPASGDSDVLRLLMVKLQQ